jgi:hypothetical protein
VEVRRPGVQYDDDQRVAPTEPGPDNASNPCSEYMHLDILGLQPRLAHLMKFRA